MLNKEVETLVDIALNERTLSLDEARPLFNLDYNSAEAAYIVWASTTLGRRASNNTGQVYAQIGLDATPCNGNCDFCGLAAKNTNFQGRAEVPNEEVVAYAKTFADAGAHLISLMCTQSYDFDHFIDVVEQVRKEIPANMPLMANMGDFNLEQARTLKMKECCNRKFAKRFATLQVLNAKICCRCS